MVDFSVQQSKAWQKAALAVQAYVYIVVHDHTHSQVP